METIVREDNWVKRADGIRPDYRKRVNLSKCPVDDDTIYHIYSNSMGQIILDPQVTIPASELWLFKNRKALDMVEVGMLQRESVNLGSFAQYVEDEA